MAAKKRQTESHLALVEFNRYMHSFDGQNPSNSRPPDHYCLDDLLNALLHSTNLSEHMRAQLLYLTFQPFLVDPAVSLCPVVVPSAAVTCVVKAT